MKGYTKGAWHLKPLTEKIVKPEESFINSYIDKFLECEGNISSTCRMWRILDAKYEKADTNKVTAKKCKHLSPFSDFN